MAVAEAVAVAILGASEVVLIIRGKRVDIEVVTEVVVVVRTVDVVMEIVVVEVAVLSVVVGDSVDEEALTAKI